MADKETKRVPPKELAKDEKSLEALKDIGNYTPVDQKYLLVNIENVKEKLDVMHKLETQAEQAYKAARDNAALTEWEFHEAILGAKNQIRAQFGVNSNEVQAIGLKKKSEWKTPQKKKASPTN